LSKREVLPISICAGQDVRGAARSGGMEEAMKAIVDKEGCISCGLCVEVCPEVFRIGDDSLAEAYTDPIPEEALESAVEAQENCPVSVITVKDE
jgi:ferredoxin